MKIVSVFLGSIMILCLFGCKETSDKVEHIYFASGQKCSDCHPLCRTVRLVLLHLHHGSLADLVVYFHSVNEEDVEGIMNGSILYDSLDLTVRHHSRVEMKTMRVDVRCISLIADSVAFGKVSFKISVNGSGMNSSETISDEMEVSLEIIEDQPIGEVIMPNGYYTIRFMESDGDFVE